MFSKSVNLLLAAAIAFGPTSANANPSFYFRFSSPPMTASDPVTPPEDPDYGAGNDIVAYYTAPTGVEFSKRIPVTTTDVREWRVSAGSLPTGITVDQSRGFLQGAPSSVEDLTATLDGYNALGRKIAEAEIHFTTFEAAGSHVAVDFYAHSGTYFYAALPTTGDVVVDTWVPVSALPDGMTMQRSSMSGTPTTAGDYLLSWRGYDFLGREVAFASGSFLVQDGPVVEEITSSGEPRATFLDQTADKGRGETFSVRPTVRHALGTVTYKLVAETARPSGVTFSSSTGVLGGVFDAFDTSATFRIQARDSYDGKVGYSNSFTLKTRPADADISGLGNTYGTVGSPYYLKLSSANILPGAKWTVIRGELPAGITLGEANGILSGTPTTTEVKADIVIGVSGVGMTPAESNPFKFEVFAEEIASKTTPLVARTDEAFSTDGVTITKGASEGFTITAESLPEGLELDAATGVITAPNGIPAAGSYGVALRINTPGRSKAEWQKIDIYNPLSVSYPNLEAARYSVIGFNAQIPENSVIGDAEFSISSEAVVNIPDWIDFNPRTGRITLSPVAPTLADTVFGPFVVTISDDRNSAQSAPFTIKVNQRPEIVIEVTNPTVRQFVNNYDYLALARNVFNGGTISLETKPANWPATLYVGQYGHLGGTTNDPVGTVYAGVVLKAVDGDGAVGYSTPFDITVVSPGNLSPLSGTMERTFEWNVGTDFSLKLPTLSNAYGSLHYSFDSAADGIAITNASSGAVGGNISEPGTYVLPFSVADDTDREPAHGTLTLKINPEFNVSVDSIVGANRASAISRSVPTITGGTAPFSRSLSGTLPSGVAYNNGVLEGTPLQEGSYPLTVTTTDKTGTVRTASFVLEVGAPLPFEVSYPAVTMYYGQSGQLAPSFSNALGGASAVTWTNVSGTLPQGVSFNLDGDLAGHFVGVPEATGFFPGISVTAVDGEGRSFTATIEIKVSRDGEINFSDAVLTHRYGYFFTDTLPVSNGISPLTFSSGDGDVVPYDLVLNSSTGSISGTFPSVGSYSFPIVVSDLMGRTDAANVTFNIVGDLSISAADASAMQYVAPSIGAPTVANMVGSPTFALASGALPAGMSVNSASGAIDGAPEENGTFADLRISASDSDGATATSNAFSIVVSPRNPLVISAPQSLELKQYSSADFDVSTADAITPVVFSISPALPAGLTFDAATGSISGSTEQTVEGVTYTISAVDSKGGTLGSSTAQFTLNVEPRDALEIVAPDVVEFTRYSDGTATVSTNNAIGSASLSIAPDLPEGFAFDPATGIISGRSDEVIAQTQYVISATDAIGGTLGSASKTIAFGVKERPQLEVSYPEITGKQYQALPAAAPSVTAGTAIGSIAYSISPTLPQGLVFDESNGTISGTPETALSASEFTVTAVDSKGGPAGTDTAIVRIVIENRDALTINGDDAIRATQFADVNAQFTTTSAVGSVSYSISPDLPAGLTLDVATGKISGSAQDVSPAAEYILSATDGIGGPRGTATKTVTLEVVSRQQLSVSMDAINGTQYQAVASTQPIVAPGTAIGAITYSVSPSLPDGLVFDAASGTVSGTPTAVTAGDVYTVTAVDSKGGPLGTASATFTLTVSPRAPLAISGEQAVTFNKYFSASAAFATTNSIGAVAYSITPDLPEGLALDPANGTISGSANSTYEATQYVLTASDAHDSVSKNLTITVADRLPVVITTSEAQPVMLGHGYLLTLDADNIVGETSTWELIGGSLPAGLAFDEATGTISGTPTEFGTTSSVTFTVTDNFEGVATKTIIFTVIQDGTPITISAQGGTARVGQPFAIPSPVATNIVGNPTWSLQAGTTGLAINPRTGLISGTPSAAFDTSIVIGIADATGREAFVSVRVVSVPAITVDVASTVPMTFNRDVPVEAGATASNAVGTVAWSVSGTLPSGVVLDTATGKFVGKPQQVGTFGPIRVTASDTLPGSTTSQAFSIVVAMNGDPIELSVTDYTTKVGQSVQTAVPAYGNNLGPVTFFSTDLSGTGLTIDPATGVLSGTAQALADATINVSVRDRDTARVTSRPLRYRVVPNMQVSLPSQVTISALSEITPVAPARNYVVGSSIWEPIDESVNRLPEGIVFDVATGTLRGTATEIGTFGPFTVSSVDSLGDRGVSNSFVVQSNPGAFFIGLANATLPDATKRIEAYSYDFKQNLTYVGMDESEITWTLGAGSPPGLTLTNGVLSGTPTLSGTYTFDVTAKKDAYSTTRAYTLVVNLPTISLELAQAALPAANRAITGEETAYSFDLKSLTTLANIPSAEVSYTLEAPNGTESFPAGLTLSTDGIISGTTTAAEGSFEFRVKASYVNATDESTAAITAYTLEVADAVAFAFNENAVPTAYKRQAFSFDLSTLLDPQSFGHIDASDLTWSWDLDPSRDPETTRNTVPSPYGLGLSGSVISGTPSESGTYALIVKASFDGREKSRAIILKVDLLETSMSLSTESFADISEGAAFNHDFKAANLTSSNIPSADIVFSVSSDVALNAGETAGIPPGMTFSTASGVLSGSSEVGGNYVFSVTAGWQDLHQQAEVLTATQTYRLAIVPAYGNFAMVSVGEERTCAVTLSGGAKCWGNGQYGALGNGTTDNKLVPTDVTGLTSGVAVVSAGIGHSCAVTTSGAAKCWGRNNYGQLGVGNNTDSSSPVSVTGLSSGVKSISVGEFHTCAVLNSGAVKCWGYNNVGQLGTANNTTATSPADVSGLSSGVASITTGNAHTCAVLNGGAAKCWGAGANGRLGNGSNANRTSPTAVTSANAMTSDIKQISAGNAYTCAVSNAGQSKCWGDNGYGQLLNVASGMTSVDAGFGHTCGINSAGGIQCAGPNSFGRIPTNAVAGYISVSAYGAHTCAVTTRNRIKCWGYNNSGQLGDNSTVESSAGVYVKE